MIPFIQCEQIIEDVNGIFVFLHLHEDGCLLVKKLSGLGVVIEGIVDMVQCRVEFAFLNKHGCQLGSYVRFCAAA